MNNSLTKEKKKILLLSDDIRDKTGVSNISKKLVFHLCKKFNIVQLAANSVLPDSEVGSIIDVSDSVTKQISEKNRVSIKLYPVVGYGDSIILRHILEIERPDIILHITDPHRWNYLYNLEYEIRQKIPITYYHVWDNYPYPMFLKSVYQSCDWIACISKLTYECVSNVSPKTDIEYIPHGVDLSIFKKLDNSVIVKLKKDFLGKNYKYVVLCNNVNIKRKELPSVIDAYAKFYRNLSLTEKETTVLLIHTNSSTSSTNLKKLLNDLYIDVPVFFSTDAVTEVHLNYIYNLSDVTLNLASNEGFGLTTLESTATHTPIIVNQTGGLHDQTDNKHKWCVGVTPKCRFLSSTTNTPYIYTDYCDIDMVARKLREFYYNYPSSNTYTEYIIENEYTSNKMCESIENGIENTLFNFKPRQRYKVTKL